MVFWWLSWSFGLLAASHGQVNAPYPLGFSRSHGLVVSWSSGGSRGLMVFWWFSWSLGLLAASHSQVNAPFPLGFSRSHGLMVSWSSGGSHGLLVFSLPLMVKLNPLSP